MWLGRIESLCRRKKEGRKKRRGVRDRPQTRGTPKKGYFLIPSLRREKEKGSEGVEVGVRKHDEDLTRSVQERSPETYREEQV